MKRHYRILTAFAMNCAGAGAYHLATSQDLQPALQTSEAAHEQALKPAGFAMVATPSEDNDLPPTPLPRPVTTIDLNTADLARQAQTVEAALPVDDTAELEPIVIVVTPEDQGETETARLEKPEIILPEVTLPQITPPAPRIILPPEMMVEADMANEPFPIPPKPDYVKFVVTPDGETANGFLEHGSRISIAESLLPEMPSAYQVLPYAENLHKLHDFPGFCTVLAHASSEGESLLWLPVLSRPSKVDLHEFSQAVASPTIQRMIASGQIPPVELPGWSIRNWVICSDRTVDGQAPFSSPRAITWLGGIHLGDGPEAEGEKSNG
jgi:hypothetical protein